MVGRSRTVVAIVWVAFVVRGLYYCVAQPMWEGLDEWAHFAAVQYFAQHGRMPARTDLVPDQVVRSLELAPLPWSNNGWIAGAANHDEFWRLPAEARAQRRRELATLTAAYRRPAELPPAIQRQYEAQQPPLYYALFTPLWWVSSGWPLPAQVLWLRVWSLLAASMTIPLAYAIARQIPASRGAAVQVAVLVAAMPSVALFVSRVANDALAVALMTLSLWCLTRGSPKGREVRCAVTAGVALGLAMLAKGYAIVLLPVFAVAAIRRRGFVVALPVALGIAGWWYADNVASTGTLAGDQMDVAAHAGLFAKLAAIPRMQWGRVVDSAAMTHIWFGGWSFLHLRAWMYRLWEAVAIVGAVGVLLRIRRRTEPLLGPTNTLAAAMALFLAATAYFSVTTFLAMNLSAGVGWYLIAMCAAEAVLLACGYEALAGPRRARIAMGATALLAIAFDFYSVHFVLEPYYTGLIRHRPNGSMEAFHAADLARVGIAEYFRRLNWVLPGLAEAAWLGYLAATVMLVVLCARGVTNSRSDVGSDQ